MALGGDHVTLEPLRPEHADELWAVTYDDEAIRAYWPLRLATVEDLRGQFQMLCGQEGTEAFLMRARDGSAAGSTTFYGIQPAHRHCVIGWTFITKPHRRTTLNTEAKFLLLREAFEERGMERVQFDVDSRNARSREAVLRIGAQQEGILRKNKVLWDGYVRDTVVFSITKEEWPAVKADLEAKLA